MGSRTFYPLSGVSSHFILEPPLLISFLLYSIKQVVVFAAGVPHELPPHFLLHKLINASVCCGLC